MDLTCDERASESPFVSTIWRSQSDSGGSFISIAQITCGIVLSTFQGQTILTVRGPETHSTRADCPPDAEFIGIQFKPGAFLAPMPGQLLSDRRDITLPDASSRSVWINGSARQVFNYENADTFVDWLVRDGTLRFDPIVEATLHGQTRDTSQRTVQRRFLHATGLTQTALYQIERARYATRLLKQGASILDTVELAGYFDQPHLTRSLKQYIGQTPAQLINPNRTERLSLLYKTSPLVMGYDTETDTFTHRGNIA